MISKYIPALWLRVVALLVFTGYMAYNELLWVAAIGSGLLILTSVQLVQAYRHR